MAFFKMFADSAKELKTMRCLTTTAVLIALDIALKSANINITDDTKISFAFLALASIGMLFGPTVGFIAGIVTDLIGMMLPSAVGAFNPLFTFVEATGAMVYGIFLYRMKYVKIEWKKGSILKNFVHVWRIIVAKIAVVIICNIILNPIAMVLSSYWTWETAIFVKIPSRLIKYAIQTPIDIVLMILVLFPVLFAYKSIFKNQNTTRADAKV